MSTTTDGSRVEATRTVTRGRAAQMGKLATKASGPVVLVLLLVIFSVTLPGTFATAPNLRSVVASQAAPGILALGLVLPLMANHFDFSIGAVASGSGVLVAVLVGEKGYPWPAAVLIVMVVAMLVGAVNGFLVAFLQYNSFVATLATGGILEGLTLMKSKGATLFQGIPPSFVEMGNRLVFGIPITALYLLGTFLLVGFITRQTAWGRHHEAIGKNPVAARLVGVGVSWHVFLAFIGSAAAAGLSGLVLVAHLGSAPPNVGGQYALSAFAAAFLGATMVRPGFFNATGTLIAVLLVAVVVNGLSLAGVSTFVSEIVTGGVLIVAVGLSRLEGLRGRFAGRGM